MHFPHYCLGIESSCDETSLALVADGRLIGHVLASQSDLHALFGGVVPELASREHYRFIGVLFDELLARTQISLDAISTVAVSRGPGLLGSLLVGVAFAKGLCLGTGARLIGVNHLYAHLLSVGLETQLTFPALGLLVSGGHTSLYRIESPLHFLQLGRTIDDACGEAFDKIGNLLGMQYPSGRMVDAAAALGSPTINFPLPYLDNETLDFSFSGLKTAVAQQIARTYPTLPFPWKRPVTDVADLPSEVHDICASFNRAVAKTLRVKFERAFARNKDITTCIVAGGVAANHEIRAEISALAAHHGAKLLLPRPALCTDNGAMVAYAGWRMAEEGAYHSLRLETIPRGRIVPEDYEVETVW